MRSFLLLLALGVTGAARAGIVTDEYRTRAFTFELKFAGYQPAVDQSTTAGPNGSLTPIAGTPYASTFKGSMLMVSVEADKVLWQMYGSLGVGVSVGYAEKYGQAVGADGAPSSSRSGFIVLPLKLLALYRLDYGAVHWNVPLVPYAKLGLIYEPWWTSLSGKVETSANEGSNGNGARLGWGFTGGLSFLLDVLEPRIARDADTDLGIKHSYFFAEYNLDNVTGFNTPGINLSSRTFMFGLAFDF